MDPVLAAATALGVTLTGVQELSRGRSLVLRARAGDRSVVLKAPLEAGPGPAGERAALRALSGVPGAVPLLAETDDPPVLVLADLGDGPSLADALLGADPVAAEAALGDWAASGATSSTTGSALPPARVRWPTSPPRSPPRSYGRTAHGRSPSRRPSARSRSR